MLIKSRVGVEGQLGISCEGDWVEVDGQWVVDMCDIFLRICR